MKIKGWCVHTKREVTPYVDPEYYWDYCPICSQPKSDKCEGTKFLGIDGTFASPEPQKRIEELDIIPACHYDDHDILGAYANKLRDKINEIINQLNGN